jgi:hypothetical protein
MRRYGYRIKKINMIKALISLPFLAAIMDLANTGSLNSAIFMFLLSIVLMVGGYTFYKWTIRNNLL